MKRIRKAFLLLIAIMAVMQCNAVIAHAAKIGKVKISKIKQTEAKGVTISWKKISRATGYEVDCKASGGDWETRITAVNGIVISKLKAGKTYQFRVRAYKNKGKKTVYGKYSGVKKLKIQKKAAVNSLSNNADDILFDWNFYVSKYSDLKKAYGSNQANLRKHWNAHGKKEGRQPSVLFDARYYLNRYADLKSAFGNDYVKAYNHFVNYGIKEGRQASASFNVSIYKGNYEDLQNAFGNNNLLYLKHWREYGEKEHRNATTKIPMVRAPKPAVPKRTISDGWYVICSGNNTNYALDISGGSTGNGGNLTLWERNGSAAQKYYLTYNSGSGFYTIKAMCSGLFVQIQDENSKTCNVHQWTGDSHTNAHWFLEDAGNGFYYLKNRSTGSYLDNAGGIAANQNNVGSYPLNRSNAQKWKFVSTSGTAPAPAPAPTPAPAPNNSDYDSKVNAFLNDARWKPGVWYGSSQRPRISTYSSSGCCAYAADFVKYVFNSNSPRGGAAFGNASEIRGGDIVYVNRPHWIVVLYRNGNTLVTVEGNWTNQTVVYSTSAYTISGNSLLRNKKSIGSFNTGYHFR